MSTATMEAPEVLSKSDEKKLLARIVEQLPEGYLRDILTELKPEILRAIDSDFASIDFDAKREIDALNEEREKLRNEVRALSSERENIRAELYRAQNEIRRAEQLKKELRAIVSNVRDI